MSVKEVKLDEFDSNIVNANAPFVMRNATLCDVDELEQGRHLSISKTLGFNDHLKADTSNMCLGLRERLSALGCSFVNNRFWEHNRGHVTRWHFDGDGVQVINICMSGSKLFEFASPCATLVVPLTNVAMLDPITEQSVVINEGDVLFFPSFWFHKVTCLQDNTITYNICTIRELKPCPRDAAYIHYHRMISTMLGSEPHFRNIYCDNVLALVPEIGMTVGLGAILSLALPKSVRKTSCAVLVGTLVYLLTLERQSKATYGMITANAIPFTLAFFTVASVHADRTV